MSQAIVYIFFLFTESQQKLPLFCGDVCAPLIQLVALSHMAAGFQYLCHLISALSSSFSILPPPLSSVGLGNSQCHQPPQTMMPCGCQGNHEQTACNLHTRTHTAEWEWYRPTQSHTPLNRDGRHALKCTEEGEWCARGKEAGTTKTNLHSPSPSPTFSLFCPEISESHRGLNKAVTNRSSEFLGQGAKCCISP